MTVLAGLKWHGGKSPLRSDGLGRWIAGLLPDRRMYVEPFAGMLGVLLSRRKSREELVNDLDGRIVNFWRVIREDAAELERLLADTPNARAEFDRCRDGQWDDALPSVERARCFAVVCAQGFSNTWRMPNIHGNSSIRPSKWSGRLTALSDRIRDVTIEQLDAAEIINRHKAGSETVMYVDPPYLQEGGQRDRWDDRKYPAAASENDIASRVEKALLGAKAACAISGDVGDYPLLVEAGWQEIPRRRMRTLGNLAETTIEEIEALVVNFDPHGQQQLL